MLACSDTGTGPGDSAQGIDAGIGSDSVSTDTGSIQDTSVAVDTTPPDVSGTGFAYLVVEPIALSFGEWPLGSVETREIELENAGDKALTLNSIALTDGSEAFATNLSQLVLGPGQKKLMKVTFYAEEEGEHTETIRFESNDPVRREGTNRRARCRRKRPERRRNRR